MQENTIPKIVLQMNLETSLRERPRNRWLMADIVVGITGTSN
jgi:hypothetical protein